MRLRKYLPLVHRSILIIIGEAALLGLVFVVPFFAIFLPGWGVKITMPRAESLIWPMQVLGLCFYLRFRLIPKVTTTGTNDE